MRPPRLEAEHDGTRLVAHDAGPAGGEVVVLLHGFPQDSGCWDAVSPPLHDGGLRTLALDQRGYAPSDRPAGVRPYRVETLAQDVLAVADTAGADRFHVVGHDWGGAVAWHLAAHRPDRVATLTALSTPHPAAYAWALTHSTQPLLSWYTAAIQLPLVPEAVMSVTLEPALRASGLPADVARRYAGALERPVALGPPLAWYRAAGRRLPWRRQVPPDVEVPTTYVWGAHDPTLGRAAAHRTTRHVLGPYRFVELPDAGHWLPELHAGSVAEAVLDRVGSA
jgi:pimeloyl-ACP methyl ester carboxylesterase